MVFISKQVINSVTTTSGSEQKLVVKTFLLVSGIFYLQIKFDMANVFATYVC